MTSTITFGAAPLTLQQIYRIAKGSVTIELAQAPKFKARIEAGRAVIDQVLANDGVIYGVTTGYGDSCTQHIAAEHWQQLPVNLTRFHGCGLGDLFDAEETRAIIAARLCSLCQGYSGVSYALLEALAALLQHDILPQIPKEGSVGASGDLTPLSYIAGALIGERQVRFNGELMPAEQAFKAAGLPVYRLKPKEALALMNGTAAMTGLACLAWCRADYLAKVSARITALAVVGANGNPYHFDEQLFQVKPHVGQQQVARAIANDLNHTEAKQNAARLQDRYSLRCAPHIIGALVDALPFLQHTIENELNSANDNPIVDPDSQRILHGGHFYGGHIAMAMDMLKTQVANLADLHDRQMALLLDPKTNHGLPANLSGARGTEHGLHHGFKAVQIGCSAWAAEALKLTMPASVFSRSTECHNQDKVSMGTIAARDALRVLELTEQVAVATLLAAWQSTELRKQQSGQLVSASAQLESLRQYVAAHFQFVEMDRALDTDLRTWLLHLREERIPV
ncbi:HAL/PAL/TAL family ammonia-lyase [Aliidiomarina celeris]|uniref:HAL/PAL/TAL family ammonia-lyase n=1 Tax=Aliidiomarina celeris TaxID=2249428 RepID=UPI000DEA106F|nr:aromatic amino acid ammonia-lyase [Aliidiomarina celeris]